MNYLWAVFKLVRANDTVEMKMIKEGGRRAEE